MRCARDSRLHRSRARIVKGRRVAAVMLSSQGKDTYIAQLCTWVHMKKAPCLQFASMLLIGLLRWQPLCSMHIRLCPLSPFAAGASPVTARRMRLRCTGPLSAGSRSGSRDSAPAAPSAVAEKPLREELCCSCTSVLLQSYTRCAHTTLKMSTRFGCARPESSMNRAHTALRNTIFSSVLQAREGCTGRVPQITL